jgi:sigma-B regulation protein RsbU (phosphoserine phosphatase)
MAKGKKLALTERERHLQKRIRELSTLYEVSKILTSVIDMDESLKLIVKTTANMMAVKACGLRLLDKSTGEMILKAVYGLSNSYIQKGRVFVWKGVYKEVIGKGQVAIVNDVATDPRFEYTEEAVDEGIKSMLSVGLLIRGETIGALSVYTHRHHIFTNDQIRIFKGIANEAAVVIERAMLYKENIENQRLDQELAAAASIQSNLMPRENPQLLNWDLAAKNVPSRTVGGDFYYFITFNETHMGIVIADVSGKGIPGAILMASARASLRAYLDEPHDVATTITKLNHVLCRDTQTSQFVSLFYGMLDTQEATLTYVNAGHNPPVLLRDCGDVCERTMLEEGGPILGVLQDAVYSEGRIQLIEGDLVLLYTDGITEAEQSGSYFGVERLLNLVQANLPRKSDEIVKTVLEEVADFSSNSPQIDDRTIILIKRELSNVSK